jgi:hypothetical protein
MNIQRGSVICEGSSNGRAPILLSCCPEKSFYLAVLKNNLNAVDTEAVDRTSISYVVPANDNARLRDHFTASCATSHRRLIFLRGIHPPLYGKAPPLDYLFKATRQLVASMKLGKL